MISVSEKHPWLHEQFENGTHAVQRSQRYWAGLWFDLVIEQTLMRSVKSTGGLTRGRCMQEGTRYLWALSLNHLASINNAMKLLVGPSVKRSEQHIDLGPSRLTQDHTDSKRFKDCLTTRNLFKFEDSNLHSLSTGFISIAEEDGTNWDSSERIGGNIQAGMGGKSFTGVRFKRDHQVKPLITRIQ